MRVYRHALVMKRVNGTIALSLVIAISFFGCKEGKPDLSNAFETGILPKVFPEYDGVTVPWNIAPLNFKYLDSCRYLYVNVSSSYSEMDYFFDSNKVKFSEKDWTNFLSNSREDSVFITVYSRNGSKWTKHNPIRFYVSEHRIDKLLLYRRIMPGYQTWNTMGVYQRELSSFKEKLILDSEVMPGTCMNCHNFRDNKADSWMLHLRENYGGTIIFSDGDLKKIQTKTDHTFGSAGFPAWHPSGNYIAFSVNQVTQIFHAIGDVRAHALDMKSDMVIYNVDRNEFFTSSVLSSPNAYEAFPCFSPDGERLYFVSSPSGKLPEEQEEMKYSLCSVSFDEYKGIIGNDVDTIISARTLGKSVSLPRVSPDGKYIMLTTLDYGNFPAYNPEADLYIYDLTKRELVELKAFNSDNVESWHSWSSNGHWVVFSSRRRDGLFMDAWIGYVDEKGAPQKPFLLPQKDPDFYDSFLFSFNVPEFLNEPFEISPYQIANVATKSKGQQAEFENSH